MNNPISRTSVTVDEAIAYLLKMIDGPVIFHSLNPDCTAQEEAELQELYFDLNEVFRNDYNAAVSDYAEAKFAQASPENLEELSSKREAVKQKINYANKIRCVIDDELMKPSNALRIDTKLSSANEQYISLISLQEWAKANPTIVGLKKTFSPIKEQAPSAGNEPWWQHMQGDPVPKSGEEWYTAARYFARELLKIDQSLIDKKDHLAEKVVEEFSKHQIYKRGRKKPFMASTIKKAFANLNF